MHLSNAHSHDFVVCVRLCLSYDINCSPDKRQIMWHNIDPLMDQLSHILSELYPAPETTSFAASDAFASYTSSGTPTKITVFNPNTQAVTHLSVEQVGARFADDDLVPLSRGDSVSDSANPTPSNTAPFREGTCDDSTADRANSEPAATQSYSPLRYRTTFGITCIACVIDIESRRQDIASSTQVYGVEEDPYQPQGGIEDTLEASIPTDAANPTVHRSPYTSFLVSMGGKPPSQTFLAAAQAPTTAKRKMDDERSLTSYAAVSESSIVDDGDSADPKRQGSPDATTVLLLLTILYAP